jgi:phosphoglycolate phosphatase
MLVVFDLDGTLIDSVRDLAASASELVTSLGGRPLESTDVATMVGDGALLLVKRALSAAGLDADTPGALPRFLEIYSRRLLETTTAYAGVEEALAIASRRARLAVLTNKPLAASQRILEGLGLARYFDTVIGGDGPLGRKPLPAGLQLLARGSHKFHPSAQTTRAGDPGLLLVGDSPIDWQTATAGGCAFAWARYGFGAARFGHEPPGTPYVLERPIDLVDVLDRFTRVMTGA